MWLDFGEFQVFPHSINAIQMPTERSSEMQNSISETSPFSQGPPNPWWTLQTCWVSYLGCRLLTSTENAQVCSRKLNPGSRHVTRHQCNTAMGRPAWGVGVLLSLRCPTSHPAETLRRGVCKLAVVRSGHVNRVVTAFREGE